MPKRILKSELDEIGDLHGRIALHAKALAGLERAITNRIERSDIFTILVADTAIAENYADPAKCLAWLAASHRSWLRANSRFNEMAERLVLYRYILLPYPSLLYNPAERLLLTEIIKLHLHLHLWHGVICGVVFVDPRKRQLARVLQDLNFVSIPSQRIFLDTPAFYRADGLKTSVHSDSEADQRLKDMQRILFRSGKGRPIWLHYDEDNFSRRRLRGWRWEALRLLFRNLYGPKLRCSLCGTFIGAFELDHIAPVSRGFYQTIVNFRPLCRGCNRKKRDLVIENPYQLQLLLSEDFRTRELDDMHRLPPAWLGRIVVPPLDGHIDPT